LFKHPLPSTLKAVTGSLVHSLGLYLFVLLLLNHVKWSRRCGCPAPDGLPGIYCGYQSCCPASARSHPYPSSCWSLFAYPLWWRVWRLTRLKS